MTWMDVAKEFQDKEHGFIETRRMAEEIVRLRKVLAKEVSENDEIGTEYTYVISLRDQLRLEREYSEQLKEALEDIAHIVDPDDGQSIAREALALPSPTTKL